MKERFQHILVIAGNHEYMNSCSAVESGQMSPKEVIDVSFVRSRLSNAIVLHHSCVILNGIHIYGSPWLPWHDSSCPENGNSTHEGRQKCWQEFQESQETGKSCPTHRFHEIPEGIDVLLTHGPARGILDCLEGSRSPWGSSTILHDAIVATRPKVHLFGHLHEQRGCWWRNSGGSDDDTGEVSSGTYQGGVEYEREEGTPVYTHRPPEDYPCQLISNNAMLNNAKWERRERRIAGPARLIVATRLRPVNTENSFDENIGNSDAPSWNFRVHEPLS